jgi:two-component system C4-dicarboxylate transport response regulator DctD
MSTSPAFAIMPSPSTLVLLIDDDTRTNARLAQMLREDGFCVEVIGDGIDALRRLEHIPSPDVVVTDLMMPGASGLTVMLEARRKQPNVPVIFMTGHPDLLARVPLKLDPEPIVFTKPIEYDDLKATIGRVACDRQQRGSP